MVPVLHAKKAAALPTPHICLLDNNLYPCLPFQLTQPGASLENRVPTPASAAGADLPVQEVKAGEHHNQQEFKAAGGKTEPEMEVG